jgi:hypothetical protein
MRRGIFWVGVAVGFTVSVLADIVDIVLLEWRRNES